MSGFDVILQGLEQHPGALPDELDALVQLRPWLPRPYIDLLRSTEGVEGYVQGRGYLRLWSVKAVIKFNDAYAVAEFLPSAFLFATDAGPIGYVFDRRTPGAVGSVELSALADEYLSEFATSLHDFLARLGRDGPPAPADDFGPPDWLRGQVLHEKHPIALGGPPNDPSNRVLVPEDEHPRFAVFFSRTLQRVREGSTQ